MNDRMLSYISDQVKMVSKSLGLPTYDELVQEPPEPRGMDEINEELYERDDWRQFHVPVTQTRDGFYTILAKSAEDAEGLAWQRLRLARDVDGSFDRWDVGTAIEA